MRAAVVVFPGSNCDRDVAVALRAAGAAVHMAWHGDAEMPAVDLIVLPGGFSYGDYLRCGAMAAHSPAMREVVARAGRGVPLLGICNGFQVLTECGLLPGALLRNAGLSFVCRDAHLRVERSAAPFTGGLARGSVLRMPVAHGDGNFHADPDTLARIEGDGRVAFRYVPGPGEPAERANPNGALNDIAGIVNGTGTVLGLMPHPERAADPLLEGTDGGLFLSGVVAALR